MEELTEEESEGLLLLLLLVVEDVEEVPSFEVGEDVEPVLPSSLFAGTLFC
jgi:hypothetical protein